MHECCVMACFKPFAKVFMGLIFQQGETLSVRFPAVTATPILYSARLSGRCVYMLDILFSILSRTTLLATAPPCWREIAPMMAYMVDVNTTARPDELRFSGCEKNG